jgi:hypothetical protein
VWAVRVSVSTRLASRCSRFCKYDLYVLSLNYIWSFSVRFEWVCVVTKRPYEYHDGEHIFLQW